MALLLRESQGVGEEEKTDSPLQFVHLLQRLRYDSQKLKGSWIDGAALHISEGTIVEFSRWNLKP